MEIINHEYYVSLELAKLLKKAGFDWECNHYYFTQNGKTESKSDFRYPARNYNGTMATMDSKSFEFEVCSRPTLDVAQRWLREVKNIQIIASPLAGSKNWTPLIAKDFWLLHEDISGIALTPENFDTYEEALEAGILKCLTLLLESNE